MKTKILLWILVGLLIIAGAAFWMQLPKSSLGGKAVENSPIEIGAPLALTGKLASYGEEIMKGADLAVSEINNKGGIKGRPIKTVYEDTKGEPQAAVSSVTKLTEIDKVSLILGPAGSGELLAIAPLTEKKKVIVFTPIAGSDEITNAGDFVFRNRETAGLHAKRMAAWLSGRGITNVAVIYASSANAVSYKTKFVETFQSLDGKIDLSLEYDPSQTDFKSEVGKIKESNAEAVYISPISGVDAGLIAKQLRESGFNGIISGALALDSPEFFKSAGSSSEEVFVTSPAFDINDPKVKEYALAFRTIGNALNIRKRFLSSERIRDYEN